MTLFNKKAFPRVLVIDHFPFNRYRNNGIVKSNLFEGWPKDSLAQIDYSNFQPGFDVCESYWMLKKSDIVRGLFGKYTDAEVKKPLYPEFQYSSDNAFSYENRPVLEKKLSILPSQLRLLIGEAIFRLPSLLSPPLTRWIDRFEPDIIFSMLSSGAILKTVLSVATKWHIPVLPYFTDDWITTLYRQDPQRFFLRNALVDDFNKCLSLSPIRLTICDAMSKEYEARYGGKFVSFMNLVVSDGIERMTDHITNGPTKFYYIGSLAPDRYKSLREIGESLLALREEGVDGELSIYTFPHDIQLYKSCLSLEPAMRIVGTAQPADVVRLQREADVLVHVESFDDSTREYTKFSVSTKIPQYLMAGACVLAYGPEELASIQYLKSSKAAIIASEGGTSLKDSLRSLITNRSLRQQLGQSGKSFALKNHEANAERERFLNAVKSAVAEWQLTKRENK